MIFALAAGLLAGCGGDDDDVTSDDATSDDASSDDATSEDASSAGSGDEVDAFCAEAQGVVDGFADLREVSGPTPELFQEVSDAFGSLVDDAPEAIRGDVETLVGGLSALGDVLEGVDPDDPASLATLSEEIERLEEDGSSIQEAGANVEAYLSDECGIDLDADTSATEDPAAEGPEDGEPSEGG